MSMEIHVLFRGKLPSKAALTRCFRELGFPLSFQRGTGLLERQEGYLPMRLRGEEAGVEFDTFDSREWVEEIAGKRIDPSFSRGANFRWSSSAEEGIVATCFAATLAKLVDGAVFDAQAGQILTLEHAVANAREWLEETKPTAKLPGTRPADIRRYLKPLLQQRSDLVLVGRRLVIPPIRHVVRAAFFEPSGNRFRLNVGWICNPLYDDSDRVFDYALREAVWQPHFQPLLLSSLAEGVFDRIGSVTTLAEFTMVKSSLMSPPRLAALVLADERDRAASIVEQIERRDPRIGLRFRKQFEELTSDVAATCARYHAREAETIRKLKLERVWEPSPFPVEVPAAQRASRCSEPVLVTKPWPSAPSWLWQDLRLQPGEVCYARSSVRRGEEIKLLVPLTMEEAEDRHRALEDYVVVRREPDNRLLTISHRTGWDRNNPEERPPGLIAPSYYVHFSGDADGIVATTSSTYFEYPGLMQIFSISVCRKSNELWLGYFVLHEGRRSIHDWRSGENVYTSIPLTEAERDLCTFPTPGFGEYQVMVERVRALLRIAGYGEVL
jgi:hypothetical protein